MEQYLCVSSSIIIDSYGENFKFFFCSLVILAIFSFNFGVKLQNVSDNSECSAYETPVVVQQMECVLENVCFFNF